MDWAKYDQKVNLEGLKKDVKAARENSRNGDYEEVPEGVYEVKIDKMELKESKKGYPMVSIWFKIQAGQYKNSLIFYNQVITQDFQIAMNEKFLQSLKPGFLVEFFSYKDYEDLIMDVAEECSGRSYQLDYGKSKKGYPTFTISKVFED